MLGSKHNMDHPVSYQKASLTDFDPLTELLGLLFQKENTKRLRADTKSSLVDPKQAMFLAYDGDLAIGTAHVSVRQEDVEGSHGKVCGYLEALYVRSEHRLRRGVALKLLGMCETWAARNRCKSFASDCFLDNTGSYQFHIRAGFTDISRNVHFIKEVTYPFMTSNPIWIQ